MSQTKHTDGPWEASNSITHWHNRSRPEDDRKDMMDYSSTISCIAPFKENEHGGFEECETQSAAKAFGRTKEECLANARLIAAAPELLISAQLGEMMFTANTNEEINAMHELGRLAGWDGDQMFTLFFMDYRRAAIAKAEGK